MNADRDFLEAIYASAIAAVEPRRLVRGALSGDDGRFASILALGKAAWRMARGAVEAGVTPSGLVVVPAGYEKGPLPEGIRIVEGGHPSPDERSLMAGADIVSLAERATGPVLVLLSGGASAAADLPVSSLHHADFLNMSRRLVRSGLSIEDLNLVRMRLSRIKGGKLGAMLPAGSKSLILSDVPEGKEWLVGSGPTITPPRVSGRPAPEVVDPKVGRLLEGEDDAPAVTLPWRLLADNATLVDAAARCGRESGLEVLRLHEAIEMPVDDAADHLHELIAESHADLVVAGGEPTVVVRGDGRGGRCFELAARLMLHEIRGGCHQFVALLGSSDGRDGNSGAAGVVVDAAVWRTSGVDEESIERALYLSDTASLAGMAGGTIIMEPTGTNVRDLYLLARG